MPRASRASDADDSDGSDDVAVDVGGEVTGDEEEPDSRDYQSDGLGDDDDSSASKRRKIADTGAPTVAPWNR